MALVTDTVGIELTTIVDVVEPVQVPTDPIIVYVFVLAGESVKVDPLTLLGNQVKVVAPLAVSVAVAPAQIATEGTEMEIAVPTVTVLVTGALLQTPSLPVTV